MKKDLRMNAKSPDPDDLASEVPSKSDDGEVDPNSRRTHGRPELDRSAPHIPPAEKGRIRGEE